MLRSLLFVPAQDKMLKKVSVLDADGYIIDLEDSISNNDKIQALERTEAFLKHNSIQNPIYVRVNKENYVNEIGRLEKFSQIGFMLPKFENESDYIECQEILSNHNTLALIETPLGIVNILKIASCDWVDALAFGAEDFTSGINMKNANEFLRYQKGCLVTYAKAYGKKVYDTPSFHLGVEDEFKLDVSDSVDLGFDGKLVISPKHIHYVNNAFMRVNPDEIMDIITQYESTGEAVQVINGKVYEKMHIENLKHIVKCSNTGEL